MKKKNKRGFTLIELLAVIVILAIIALIAVPIVLNMIENARKSAAKSSAYGYIQAIDDNNELYEMNEDYGLNIVEIKGTNIPVSSINLKIKGKKPTSGEVTIDAKGRVSSATLCINNYTVTYNGTEAEVGSKGCEGGGGSTPSVPTISTCPGCKFIYTTDELTIGTSTLPSGVVDDYTTLNKNYFLGVITDNNVITRAFVCGIENETAFCLEGKDATKYADPNVGTLNTVFPSCNADAGAREVRCNGSSMNARADTIGYVRVDDGVGGCILDEDGDAVCVG